MKDQVKAAWMTTFPNSRVISNQIMGRTVFKFYLQQKDEVANGISENDPLQFSAWLSDDGAKLECNPAVLFLKPTSRLMVSTVKTRKVTTKDPLKQFQKVKQMIIDNKDNWYIDLSCKL